MNATNDNSALEFGADVMGALDTLEAYENDMFRREKVSNITGNKEAAFAFLLARKAFTSFKAIVHQQLLQDMKEVSYADE